ncbi:MAG: RNA methylase, NOL1/NOP2/sun family [Candidatus Magasanikbacteria bacterium GW2011_GWA2_43_9]|nr:MAG: RNA methylase, NOL1/NOP2/sun family [Candidatus Magasanikbacteria bacterium GW2011_GWA2_43_9]
MCSKIYKYVYTCINMESEIIKKAFKLGNSAGVLLPIEWKDRKVREMAYTQRELLLSAWKSLKPGGTIVYSTCTFAPEENEMQIDRVLERFEDAIVLPVVLPGVDTLPIMKEWNGKTLSPEVQKCLRVKPTKDMEGFFIAKLQKK